jgi:hypothetical protein
MAFIPQERRLAANSRRASLRSAPSLKQQRHQFAFQLGCTSVSKVAMRKGLSAPNPTYDLGVNVQAFKK